MPMIRLEKLKRVYQEGVKRHVVFSDLDLDVNEGEIVVLLGRSGSGKSTLLNLISGIDLPDSGTVEIDSIDLTGLSEQDRTLFRREHIGFVFQFFNLIPTLSVLENLLLPLELNQKNSTRSHETAARILREVGLAGREDSFPDVLSGGEQQRVTIARALVHEPKIVLADEPTGNLDKETGLEVLHVLDTQVRKAGKTMVMATHSQEVIGMADRIFRFVDGGLREVSPKDVL
jgi:putative ABC transport system ATP-binding protein